MIKIGGKQITRHQNSIFVFIITLIHDFFSLSSYDLCLVSVSCYINTVAFILFVPSQYLLSLSSLLHTCHISICMLFFQLLNILIQSMCLSSCLSFYDCRLDYCLPFNSLQTFFILSLTVTPSLTISLSYSLSLSLSLSYSLSLSLLLSPSLFLFPKFSLSFSPDWL